MMKRGKYGNPLIHIKSLPLKKNVLLEKKGGKNDENQGSTIDVRIQGKKGFDFVFGHFFGMTFFVEENETPYLLHVVFSVL